MKRKILIVDDDCGIVDALTLILEDEGFETESTCQNKEIYEKISSLLPDIILLDVLISGVDGRDICKKLKDDIKTKNIPIIMLSAHPSAKQTVLNCGADYFIPKPFEVEELMETIQSTLH